MDFQTIMTELSSDVISKLKEFENFEIKATDKSGKFKVVANMETEDRAGDTIIVKGRDLTNFKKNPILLFGHNYRSLKDIIGKVTKITKTQVNGVPALVAEGVFANTESGQVAKELYDQEILKTVSVGFRILERGEDGKKSMITKAELLELSFVPVPCHQDALTIDKEIMRKAFEIGLLKEQEKEKGKDTTEDVEKRLEKIEGVLEKIENNLENINSKFVEKKEEEKEGGENEEEKAREEETKKALKKISVVVNTALNKYKRQ